VAVAAFFIKGDKQPAAEPGHLKGELESLEQTSIQKTAVVCLSGLDP
jgi:hypothetical protein